MRAALILAALATALGCATAPVRVEVEAPSELVETTDHVARQPVHATTELSRGSFVASTDAGDADAAPSFERAKQEEEGPDLAHKRFGLGEGK